jgi:hypothetical protein
MNSGESPSSPFLEKPTTEVPDSLQLDYGTLEEKRALHHWIVRTGPWIAQYANSEQDWPTWTKLFPRCSHTQPSTRHLLVAISMIDERLPDPTPDLLLHRSKRVLFHYNQAIQELTQRQPSMIDAAASSLLAWVLETCLQDTNRAILHLDASSRLLDAVRQALSQAQSSEETDLLKQMESARESCAGYLSTQRRVRTLRFRDLSNILEVINGRNGPQTMSSTEEARSRISDYFDRLEEPNKSQKEVAAAQAWLRSWEYTFVKYRYVSPRHDLNVVALHILVNLAKTFLPFFESSMDVDPQDAVEYVQDHMATLLLNRNTSGTLHMDGQKEAIAYILDRSDGLWRSASQLQSADQEDMAETLRLVAQKILQHSGEVEHRERASQLLQRLASEPG